MLETQTHALSREMRSLSFRKAIQGEETDPGTSLSDCEQPRRTCQLLGSRRQRACEAPGKVESAANGSFGEQRRSMLNLGLTTGKGRLGVREAAKLMTTSQRFTFTPTPK